MAKFDVQSAYSIVPVHTEVRQLLRMKWRGAFFVHMVLPFGVRSAGHISLDLVEWVAKRNNDVTFLMHYLDDFHTLGSPGSSVCQHNLDRSIDCFSKLGIPLHPLVTPSLSLPPQLEGSRTRSLTPYLTLSFGDFAG